MLLVSPRSKTFDKGINDSVCTLITSYLLIRRFIVLDWKSQLIGEADRTKNYIQDESSAMPDINDRATQEEEFALALRTRDRERKLIRKIDKSMVEIENDDYGFCETCGVEIGLRRLEARPTATQCIDCKTLSEIKERQNQGA